MLLVQPSSPTQAHCRRKHPVESRIISLLIHPGNKFIKLNLSILVRIHLLENILHLLIGNCFTKARRNIDELLFVDETRVISVNLLEDLERLLMKVVSDTLLGRVGAEPLHELPSLDLTILILIHGFEDGLDSVLGERLSQSNGHFLDFLNVKEARTIPVNFSEDIHGLLKGRESNVQVIFDGNTTSKRFEVRRGRLDLLRLDLTTPPQLLCHNVGHTRHRL
mmetsp:Transcript_44462/g.79752  ORF Transcript_44462/g.79752 Transcript_44462/m.79752 type:complete len:222 (+) Transcript_44462:214-879(+)